MSDHVLRPVHGLLEWCEWLVPVDTGYVLNIVTVSVNRRRSDRSLRKRVIYIAICEIR